MRDGNTEPADPAPGSSSAWTQSFSLSLCSCPKEGEDLVQGRTEEEEIQIVAFPPKQLEAGHRSAQHCGEDGTEGTELGH